MSSEDDEGIQIEDELNQDAPEPRDAMAVVGPTTNDQMIVDEPAREIVLYQKLFKNMIDLTTDDEDEPAADPSYWRHAATTILTEETANMLAAEVNRLRPLSRRYLEQAAPGPRIIQFLPSSHFPVCDIGLLLKSQDAESGKDIRLYLELDLYPASSVSRHLIRVYGNEEEYAREKFAAMTLTRSERIVPPVYFWMARYAQNPLVLKYSKMPHCVQVIARVFAESLRGIGEQDIKAYGMLAVSYELSDLMVEMYAQNLYIKDLDIDTMWSRSDKYDAENPEVRFSVIDFTSSVFSAGDPTQLKAQLALQMCRIFLDMSIVAYNDTYEKTPANLSLQDIANPNYYLQNVPRGNADDAAAFFQAVAKWVYPPLAQ